MAKQTVTDATLVKDVPSVDALIARAKQNASLTKADKLRTLADLFGVPSNQIEVISAGKVPFWPALDGATIFGTVQNYRRIETKFGEVGLYMLRVEKNSTVGGSADKDGNPVIEELKPGSLCTVIEREVMKNLGQDGAVGRTFGIMCLGQVQGAEFPYWDYAIFAQKDAPPALQAASGQ